MKFWKNGALKNHFIYNWWKYLLVLLVGIFGVDLLYTVTEPRIPDDKKIEMISCGLSLNQDFEAYMENVRLTQMTDMIKMESTEILIDDTTMQYLATRLFTRGGDLYLLPREQFKSMVLNGVLLPLDQAEDADIKALLEDLDPDDGWGTTENSNEKHLYGIPRNLIPGLNRYFLQNDDFLCILSIGNNVENAKKFFVILCRDMSAGIPEIN